MKFLTWDIGILAAFGMLLAYSLIVRKHKALATLVSIYIAYLMTATWGERVTEFFAGDRVFLSQVWIKANASPFAVRAILLVVLTILLSSFIKLGGRRSRYGVAEVVVYTVAALALAVSFIMAFMAPEQREAVLATSRIMPYVFQWREWILGLPVLAMVLFGIYGNEEA